MKIILILSCLLFFSCTKRSQDPYVLKKIEYASLMKKGSSNYQIIDVDKAIKVNMDSVVVRLDSISYIPLESTDLIGEMDKVLVYDNKIYILDAFVAEKVFIFDKRGVLLKTIDNKGQGPDEYAGLSGMSIDFDKRELCLNDRLTMKKLYFDLDGKFLRKENSIPCFYLNMLNHFTVNQLAYLQSFSKDVNYHLVFTQLDSVYSKGFPYEPIQKRYVMSKNAVFNSTNDLLFVPVLSDTVYHIKSFNEYCVRYVLKHKRSVWNKHGEELSYNEVVKLIKNDGYTAFSGLFYETSKYIYFSMERSLNDLVTNVFYMYDKKKKQVYELDGRGMTFFTEIVPPDLIALDGEMCVSSFDPYRLKGLFSDNDKGYIIKNNILKAIIEKSDENSNPVLVFYQLK